MQLSLEHRRVGDATVLACKGRLIAGPEAVALQKAVGDLMPLTRHLVLHLGEVDFIDSCGLGQLVRTLQKTDASSSQLTWDVETESGLPIGSGVYIYHVEAPGVGQYVSRLVVFMEKERLNSF